MVLVDGLMLYDVSVVNNDLLVDYVFPHMRLACG